MILGRTPDSQTQLALLLRGVARLVATGGEVTDAQLNTLLLATDAWDEPSALAELRSWAGALLELKSTPTAEARRAAVQALVARGLPEPPVEQAVSILAPGAAGDDDDKEAREPIGADQIDIVAAANYVVAGSKGTQGNASKSARPREKAAGPTAEETIVAQLGDLLGISEWPASLARRAGPNPLFLDGSSDRSAATGPEHKESPSTDAESKSTAQGAQDELRRQLDEYFRAL